VGRQRTTDKRCRQYAPIDNQKVAIVITKLDEQHTQRHHSEKVRKRIEYYQDVLENSKPKYTVDVASAQTTTSESGHAVTTLIINRAIIVYPEIEKLCKNGCGNSAEGGTDYCLQHCSPLTVN